MCPKVKLIAGLLACSEERLESARTILRKRFGPTDLESPLLAFNCTSYYNWELGEGIKRQFVSFETLIDAERSEDIKRSTIAIEDELSLSGKRTVNIDPGYLELSKLVLFSTKNYSHRIYLGKGIFAEITLIYRNGSFHPLEWTYPDYQSSEYRETFGRIRDLYKAQKKEERHAD